MTHSPEPWTATGMVHDMTLARPKRGKPKAWNGLFDANGVLIGDSVVGWDYCDNSEAMDRYDLRRIVACVNYCRNLSTDFLEANIAEPEVQNKTRRSTKD